MLKEEARAPLHFYVKRTSTDQLKTSPVPTISLPKSKTQQRKHELKKECLALPSLEPPTICRRWTLFPKNKTSNIFLRKGLLAQEWTGTFETNQVFLSTVSQLRTLPITNTYQLQLRAELVEAVEALCSVSKGFWLKTLSGKQTGLTLGPQHSLEHAAAA